MDDEDRTTSFGLLRFAKDYMNAALMVSKPPQSFIEELRHEFREPAYFLVGHSIELSLKAFLRGRGTPLKKLRHEYGHDLEKLFKEARRRRLGNEVKLSRVDIEAIRLLNQTYKNKHLEYIVTGTKSVPSYKRITDVAVKLVNGLMFYCYRMTFNKPLKRDLANRFAVRSAS